MANARKLPSGQYRCLAYMGKDPHGKRIYQSFTAPTKPEAEELAARAQRRGVPLDSPSCTFSDAFDNLCADNENIWSPTTLRKYKSINRTHLTALASLPVHRIDSRQIQRVVNQAAAAGSPKTVSCVYSLISSVLRYARPDFRPDVNLPALTPHALRILESALIPALLSAVSSNQSLHTAVMIAASVGLREAEISALTWADYDPAAKTLRVDKQYIYTADNKWILRRPKSAAGIRTVSVPDACAKYLASLPRPDDVPADRARIVPLTPHSIGKAFHAAMTRAGISCRFHDLRHYYSSILLALGVPDKYAMARTGHATNSALKQVYQHLLADKNAEIDSLTSTAFSAVLSPASPPSPSPDPVLDPSPPPHAT